MHSPPRYVLYPGYVVSRHDGERHFIGVGHLLRLYRVPPNGRWVRGDEPGFQPRFDDILCVVRYDGDYPMFT